MNKVKDLNGRLVIFGDDYLIKEIVSEGVIELVLFAAGERHLLARGPIKYSFASNFPAQLLADFRVN